MADHPCRCETCPRFYIVTDEHGGETCPLGYSYAALSIIPKVGCLSHPQAREYLMQPVIEEMEHQAYIADTEGDINKVESLDALITLIKNGVGGK